MGPPLQITGSLRPLALTLALLVATAARPTQDASGVSRNPASGSADRNRCLSLANTLYSEATDLKNKICESQNICDNSTMILAENNLVFPNLTEQDGCFHSEFNKEACLIKIISNLQEFDGYLQFMESEMTEKKSRAELLKVTTADLALALNNLMKVADPVPTLNPTASHNLVLNLKSLEKWPRKVALHLSLWYYIKLMEHTIRIIRYMYPTNDSA
ncbi:interleukin-6 [Sminthopsis crassicaudata]|uniref:interleukin-6 n=1 Tax=Sminthopsis crassicaudata TaxID=9301 RepID=UPI003D692786